jgi:hypothetical protein
MAGESLLATITAKILRIVEAVLDNFVTVTGTQATDINGCVGSVSVYVVDTTTCGDTLAFMVANLAVMGLNMINVLLPGLFAVEA